jgi:proline iminopeptidase
MHPWVTSQYEHNGSNASGGGVLDRLIGLARGDIAR